MSRPRSIISSLPSPQLYHTGGGSIAADYERLTARVHDAVSDSATAHTRLCELLPDLWALRLRALTEETITQRDNVEGIEAYYGRQLMRPLAEPLSLLAECVQVALRGIARVADAMGREDAPILPSGLKASDLPTYEKMSVLLAMLPFGQRMFEFINSSLLIEMGISVFDDLSKQKRPMPSVEVLHEMCSIINQASSAYGGAARGLGIVKKRSSGRTLTEFAGAVDADFLAESNLFAEAGIAEWRQQLYELDQA